MAEEYLSRVETIRLKAIQCAALSYAASSLSPSTELVLHRAEIFEDFIKNGKKQNA